MARSTCSTGWGRSSSRCPWSMCCRSASPASTCSGTSGAHLLHLHHGMCCQWSGFPSLRHADGACKGQADCPLLDDTLDPCIHCDLMSIYLMSMQLVYLLCRYAQLSLGKYSVLREADFVRRASRKHPQLQYLYLGYYIPNNEKMMYKARTLPCL